MINILRIIYSKYGDAHSDFHVDEFVKRYEKVDYINHDYELNVSTENVIYAVRIAIKEGRLDYKNVVGYFDETTVTFDKDAFPCGNYPSTYIERMLDKLIGIR